MKSPYSILIRPLFSENSLERNSMPCPQYTFKVDMNCNKHEIKRAVEEAFKVKVKGVNTIVYEGKKRRVRIKLGKRPDWKKAIITLEQGQSIELI